MLQSITLLSLLSLSGLLQSQAYKINIISGAKFELIEYIILHESSIPLNFDLPINIIDELEIPKNNLSIANCINKSNKDICKHKNQLKLIQNGIHELLNQSLNLANQELKPGYLKQKRAFSFIGETLSACCDIALKKSIKELALNNFATDNQVNNLMMQVKKEHSYLTETEVELNELSSDLNDILSRVNNSITVFEKNVNSDLNGTINSLEHTLLNYIHESWLYTYVMLHQNYLNRIKEQCAKNFIPRDILSPDLLKFNLNNLNSKLIKHQQITSIPLSKIALYYKLPICSCIYNHESITLKIQVPLQRINTDYVVYRYKPINFLWEDNICKFSDENLIIIKINETFKVLHNHEASCDLEETGLCHIPRIRSNFSQSGDCALYLMNNTNISELQKFCEFHCRKAPNHLLISQISMNKFLITNTKQDLKISCLNSTSIISRITLGTIELSLPCNCKLVSYGETIIETTNPCDYRDFESPEYIHLIPMAWTNLQHLHLDPLDKLDRIAFHNYTNLIVNDWNTTLPTFKVHELQKIIFQNITPPNSLFDIMNDDNLLLYSLSIYTLFLSIIIAFLSFKMYILNIKLTTLNSPPPRPPKDYKYNKSTESISEIR